jgi:hypothetical protein
MKRRGRYPNWGTCERIDEAIAHLKAARLALILAECPRTLARVRRAITSADGARRYARHRLHVAEAEDAATHWHSCPDCYDEWECRQPCMLDPSSPTPSMGEWKRCLACEGTRARP